MVLASQGTSTNASVSYDLLETWAYKVRADRQGGHVKIRCLWSQRVTGPLVPSMREDLNGDGLQDFYFQAVGEDLDDVGMFLSGADGSVIAKVTPETAGTKFARTRLSPIWGWLLGRDAHEAIEHTPINLPMHVLYKYVSPGYVEDWRKHHQPPPAP